MKNINKKILKINEVYEREGYLVQLFDTNKVKDVLKQSLHIPEQSTINRLLKSSEFLSNKLFIFISKTILQEEIPFKNLEVVPKQLVILKNFL